LSIFFIFFCLIHLRTNVHLTLFSLFFYRNSTLDFLEINPLLETKGEYIFFSFLFYFFQEHATNILLSFFCIFHFFHHFLIHFLSIISFLIILSSYIIFFIPILFSHPHHPFFLYHFSHHPFHSISIF